MLIMAWVAIKCGQKFHSMFSSNWLMTKVGWVLEVETLAVSVDTITQSRATGQFARCRLDSCTASTIVKAQAATGVSQLQVSARRKKARAGAVAGKSFRAILAEGRRGVHDCNCFSNKFSSCIRFSFQTNAQFVQAIAVTSG